MTEQDYKNTVVIIMVGGKRYHIQQGMMFGKDSDERAKAIPREIACALLAASTILEESVKPE
ncbi:MAG TPA: hypothetical protein VGO47_14715 [Chlamydiales bacterium]|jgi:hypothetical protein|nr:hypothetical protein [Chlamydiales bacterium]